MKSLELFGISLLWKAVGLYSKLLLWYSNYFEIIFKKPLIFVFCSFLLYLAAIIQVIEEKLSTFNDVDLFYEKMCKIKLSKSVLALYRQRNF